MKILDLYLKPTLSNADNEIINKGIELQIIDADDIKDDCIGYIFERLKEGIQKKWDAVTGFFSGIKDRIISVWDRVTGFFSNIWTTVGEKIQGAWQTVTGFFTGIGDKIKGLWDTATSFITDGIRSGWEKVVGFFSGIVDTIKTFFKTKVAGMFKKGGLKSMAPGGGGEEGGGEVSPVVGNSVGKLAKDAGKIGKGLGNLGTGAGKAIAGVLQGLAMGLSFFKNPTVLLGAAGLAGSITLIGAGIAGAAWIMGKALPTLAEGLMAFNKVDGGNLARVGLGIGALGVGMAAMGAGTVIAGIGNLVGSLFGGGIEDTIKKVEKFSQANIDEAKVKNNANAVVSYSKAMAALGAGTALGGIGTLVGSVASAISGFFDKKPPIQKMIEFSKLNINAAKVKENAEAVTLYSKAMASLGGGSALSGLGAAAGAIGSAIGKFFGEKPPIEKMQDFARKFSYPSAFYSDAKTNFSNKKNIVPLIQIVDKKRTVI